MPTLQAPPAEPVAGFVPVRVVADVDNGAADANAAGGDVAMLLVGGWLLCIPPGFDAASLARVVTALEGSTPSYGVPGPVVAGEGSVSCTSTGFLKKLRKFFPKAQLYLARTCPGLAPACH